MAPSTRTDRDTPSSERSMVLLQLPTTLCCLSPTCHKRYPLPAADQIPNRAYPSCVVAYLTAGGWWEVHATLPWHCWSVLLVVGVAYLVGHLHRGIPAPWCVPLWNKYKRGCSKSDPKHRIAREGIHGQRREITRALFGCNCVGDMVARDNRRPGMP